MTDSTVLQPHYTLNTGQTMTSQDHVLSFVCVSARGYFQTLE